MASEAIYRMPRISAAMLREQIDAGVSVDEVFSVMIERYSERRAVSELLNVEYPRYELVAFYTDSVQLRRVA
jgi:hypothetical protein